MQILVAGGFGYLGSILVDLLTIAGNHVDIYDTCMWDNEETKESIKFRKMFNYIPSTKIEEIDEYDCIVWCANIDSERYYCEQLHDHKLRSFLDFNELASLGKKFINCSTFRLNYQETKNSPAYQNLIEREMVAEKYNQINIRIPSLYGPSPRMRWDTYINSMILSCMTQKKIYIESDWLTDIPICHVVNMAEYIRELCTIPSTNIIRHFQLDMFNLIEISHIIGLSLGIKDIEVITETNRQTVPNNYDIQGIPWSPNKKLSIKDALVGFKKNIEIGNLPNFLDDKFNNEVMIDNFLKSYRFWKR